MAIGYELERANGTNMSILNGGLSTSLHVDSLTERGSSSENENMVKSESNKDPTSPSLSPAPNADRLAEYELAIQLGTELTEPSPRPSTRKLGRQWPLKGKGLSCLILTECVCLRFRTRHQLATFQSSRYLQHVSRRIYKLESCPEGILKRQKTLWRFAYGHGAQPGRRKCLMMTVIIIDHYAWQS